MDQHDKDWFRACLVLHGMQNINYQLLWNDKIQNTKIFRVMFSSIQNAEFIAFVTTSLEALLSFFLSLEAKIKKK